MLSNDTFAMTLSGTMGEVQLSSGGIPRSPLGGLSGGPAPGLSPGGGATMAITQHSYEDNQTRCEI